MTTRATQHMNSKQSWWSALNVFCTVAANSMIVMFLSPYLKSRGVAEVKIGGILGTYHIVMPVVILLFGLLSDRVSCRRLIMYGSLVSIFYCFFMPLLSLPLLMVIMNAVGGIGITLAFIIANVLFLKTLNQHQKRGKRLSLFVAAMTSGYAIGSALCSVVVKELNFPMSAIFYCALPLYFVTFLTSFKLPEVPIERFPIIQYFHDIMRVPVFCIALVAFTLGAHWGAEGFVIIRFLDSHLSASGYEMALFFILTGVTLSVFSRIAGHIMDTHGNMVKIVVPGLIVSGLFHGLTAWVTDYPQFLILRLLHTCGDGAINFALPMLVSLVFTASRVGGNFGFSRTINSIGTASGAAFSGYLVARYSMGSPLWITGFFQVGVAGLLWMLKSHFPVAERQSVPVLAPVSSHTQYTSAK